MKTSNTIIGFPGEKRNARMMKQFLFNENLIGRYEMEQDAFDVPKLSIRFVSMRTQDAVDRMMTREIKSAISGIDALSESLLARRMKLRQDDPLAQTFSESITGFDPLPPRSTGDIFTLDFDNRDEAIKRPSLRVSTTFDTIDPAYLRILVRDAEREKLLDIERISRRGELLTSYPYLVRSILARKYGGSFVGSIKKVEGKTEALLANNFGESAVDIVDTGETARQNNLALGPTLFESYPTLIVSEEALADDAKLRTFVNTMTTIANEAYYNSSRYRQVFSRG